VTLHLRPVTLDDARQLFVWANDPDTRRQSLSTDEIVWGDHLLWLEGKLEDPLCTFYLVERDGAPIGQVRFDREQGAAETIAVISISLDPALRRQGLGTAAITAALAQLQTDAPVAVVHAFIKRTNPASLRAFHKAGFRDARASTGQDVLRLTLRP
jgi:RimJ/RimL family protein N-acetyltransferase